MAINPPVVRFAPSPTGEIHLGTARMALFNRLFANRYQGIMRLRIEDTDRVRSTDSAREDVLNTLRWLDIPWDGEIVFQSHREKRHREIAHRLLKTGAAYRCYCTPEELESFREIARAAGKPPRYDGRWRERDPGDAPEGTPHVIRIKTPQDGTTQFVDQVQGTISIPNADIDDFVLLRQDGRATYMLAVVVDDHDMGVTHVIRGADHLTNTARQLQIARMTGWPEPVFAHVPLIHGSDGAKLSKRHGAYPISEYRQEGYLPEALCAYMARLGWSHGDDEHFSRASLNRWFDLDAISRSPARFDSRKLAHTNGLFMRSTSPDDLVNHVRDLADNPPSSTRPSSGAVRSFATALNRPVLNKRIRTALPSLQARASTLNDLAVSAGFIIRSRPLVLDEKARQKIDSSAQKHLTQIADHLQLLDPWEPESIESSLRNWVTSHSVKFGDIAQPIRGALTGSTTSPGIFDVLASLGKDESIDRLRDACGPIHSTREPISED